MFESVTSRIMKRRWMNWRDNLELKVWNVSAFIKRPERLRQSVFVPGGTYTGILLSEPKCST
jgi:hypothetical protein